MAISNNVREALKRSSGQHKCYKDHCFAIVLAPVPGKPISTNRGLNPLNQGIKVILRLVSFPESTISAIQGIN